MKTTKAGLLVGFGAMVGVCVALCVGAVEKPAKDWSRVKFIAYPNGGTGVFDPDTATLYVYDSNLRGCYLVRQITTLGQPMRRP